MAAAIAAGPAAGIATAVLAGGTVSVPAAVGAGVTVGADDVIVTQTPRAGWAVATDAGETVAIDTTITPELRREGLAREVIRLVQDARKSDGLDVTDRIVLRWSVSDADLSAALTEHAALIAGEVLAVEFGPVEADEAEAEPGTRGSTWMRNLACGSGSGGPDRVPPASGYSGDFSGLIREAGATGSAASVPGGGEGHLVQVAIAHEADEDAAGVVIPGDARDHGYFHARVRAGGFGFSGFLVLLGLLGLGLAGV